MSDISLVDGKRVLIVDDEPDILDTLEDLLSMCTVTSASSFREAKEYLENDTYDIAILDIMGVKGYELLEMAKNKGIVPIMLTAHAMTPLHLKKSFQNGAASFIPKDELSQIVTFLNDILEAREKGISHWWRWLDRFEDYFDKKFGPEWQKEHKIVVR